MPAPWPYLQPVSDLMRMYLDGVSRNVDPPDTVAVNEPKTSEQGVFSACPLEPLPCHQPSARQVLKPATINATVADKSTSARTPPTRCVSWSSSSWPVR